MKDKKTKKHGLLYSYIKYRLKKEKKAEFSKKLCLFSIAVMVLSIATSVVLSCLGKDPLIEVDVAIITTCGGYLCTYGIKSAFEKNSRNKYGIDSDGVPYCQKNSSEEEEVNG